MGFWAALEEVFPATRGQRCWFLCGSAAAARHFNPSAS